MPKEGNTVLQLYLQPDLKEWLRGLADRNSLSMSTTVKILLQRERARERERTAGTDAQPFMESALT